MPTLFQRQRFIGYTTPHQRSVGRCTTTTATRLGRRMPSQLLFRRSYPRGNPTGSSGIFDFRYVHIDGLKNFDPDHWTNLFFLFQPIALLSAVLILRNYATDDEICKYSRRGFPNRSDLVFPVTKNVVERNDVIASWRDRAAETLKSINDKLCIHWAKNLLSF